MCSFASMLPSAASSKAVTPLHLVAHDSAAACGIQVPDLDQAGPSSAALPLLPPLPALFQTSSTPAQSSSGTPELPSSSQAKPSRAGPSLHPLTAPVQHSNTPAQSSSTLGQTAWPFSSQHFMPWWPPAMLHDYQQAPAPAAAPTFWRHEVCFFVLCTYMT